MARPIKKGLDYYPLDVDFLQDIKVRKVMRACGVQSIAILISLLSSIYRDEGYYVVWDSDMSFLVADEVGTSEGAVSEVVTKAVQVDFFDENIFKKYKVLTSNGIQKRFLEVVKRRKSVDLIAEYFLLDLVDVNTNLVNVNINSINADRSTQRKVKERKVKDSKEINVPADAVDDPSVPKNDYRYLEDSTEYKAAVYLREQILGFNPKCRVPDDTVKDLQAWADTIRLTFEIDERTKGEMHEVIKYIFHNQEGEFWRPNVQSPTSLRKNWDTIYGQMIQANKPKKNKRGKATTLNNMQGRDDWNFEEIAELENERLKRNIGDTEGLDSEELKRRLRVVEGGAS